MYIKLVKYWDKYTEMHGQQNDKYTEMHGQQNDKYTDMRGQQNDKYTEMHGQQNDKYTEMHGQQNDKYTEMHGQQNVKICLQEVAVFFPPVHNFSLPLFASIFIYILFSSTCTTV